MPFLPETQTIIREVERLSGRPVHVQEDHSLKVLATVQTARGAMPAHFVRYKGDSQAASYLVAYQLGFLVRMFSCPPDERFEVAASPADHRIARERLGLMEFEPQFAQGMAGSIITQVRSIPVGMRVDWWIRREYPALIAEQSKAAQTQLATNEQALAPEIRGRFPKPLVDANTAMNAAFTAFWSGEWGDRKYKLPYALLGCGPIAAKLLAALDEIPDDPLKDRELIARWAELTGLDGLFHFEPHQLD